MENQWQKNYIGSGWEFADPQAQYHTSMLQTFSKVLSNFQSTHKYQGITKPTLKKALRNRSKKNLKTSPTPPKKQLEYGQGIVQLPSFADVKKSISSPSKPNTVNTILKYKARISERQSKYLQSCTGDNHNLLQKPRKNTPICIAVLDPNIEKYNPTKHSSEYEIAKQMSIFESRQLARNRQRLRLQVFCVRQRIASFGKNTVKLKAKFREKVFKRTFNQKEFEDFRMFRS